MRLDPSTMVAGRPALEIRRLLRCSSKAGCGIRTVCREFGISAQKAKTILGELEEAQLLVQGTVRGLDGRERPYWENTMKGNTLAMASSARPVKRSTAERVIDQFLDRVATVNGGERFAYRVQRVTVFGSYLTQADRLNDVDLLVDLASRKTIAKEQEALEESARARAVQGGRRFGTYFEELTWPQTEVCLFLKNRSRTLSLHYIDHALVEKTEHRVIFEDHNTPQLDVTTGS